MRLRSAKVMGKKTTLRQVKKTSSSNSKTSSPREAKKPDTTATREISSLEGQKPGPTPKKNSLPPQPVRPDNNVVQLDDNIEDWKYKGMQLCQFDFKKLKDLFSIQSRLLLALKTHIPGPYNVVVDHDPENPKEITLFVREELRVTEAMTSLSDTLVASIKVISESQFSYYVFNILAREVAENLGITVAVLRSASKYAFGTPIICCETADGDYVPAEEWASLLEPLIKKPIVAGYSNKAGSVGSWNYIRKCTLKI